MHIWSAKAGNEAASPRVLCMSIENSEHAHMQVHDYYKFIYAHCIRLLIHLSALITYDCNIEVNKCLASYPGPLRGGERAKAWVRG